MNLYHIHLISIIILICILLIIQFLSYLSIDEELSKVLLDDNNILRHHKLKNSLSNMLPNDMFQLRLFDEKEKKFYEHSEVINKQLSQLQTVLSSVDRTQIFLSVSKQTLQRYISINKGVQRLDERLTIFCSTARKQKIPALVHNDFHEIFKETQHLSADISTLRDEILDKVRTEISWQQDFVIVGPFWLPLLVPVLRVLQVAKKKLSTAS